MLKDLQKMYDELMTVNSKLTKLKILKKYPENKKLLFYIYHPRYVYGVTSDNLKKNKDLISKTIVYISIISLLDDLRTRKLTGHAAISATNNFIKENEMYKDLLYKIFDRNLKTGIGVTEINKIWPKLIPEFKVQLASKYDDKSKINYEDKWFASRKMDGIRCLAIMDENGNPTFFSRGGKEFLTLTILKNAILKLPLSIRKNAIFDGELCIIDNKGNEDFTSIIKLYKRKDFTIPNPHYKIFDYMSTKDFFNQKGSHLFDERYDLLKKMEKFNFDKNYMTVLEQIVLKDDNHLMELYNNAIKQGWEGLIIRKNIPYSGKRSKDMLKVKKFHDAEFKIIGTETTTKQMLNKNGIMKPVKCMGSAIISYKGSTVNVGSGWSDSERIEFFKHPEKIIGKTITVKYFQESVDESGKPSLRFPIKKAIFENERTI